MKLLTKELLKKLPPLYAGEEKGEEAIALVKFFCPWSHGTWYLSEYDPVERLGFGVCVLFERELGYVSLAELESIKGPAGLGIERDLYWTPRPLKECK